MPRGSREGIKHATKFRWPPWRERFEANVDRTPGFGPWGDCHRWTGTISGYPGNQYGVLGVNGRCRVASRLAWEIATGQPFPTGKLALHSCDVSICVNPEHISPGTQAENMQQAAARGRLNHQRSGPANPVRGERHHKARFTTADIHRIRSRHANGQTVAALARDYGAAWATIDRIVKRTTWRHLT